MKLRSDNFEDGDYLSAPQILSAAFGFGCDGGNRSPHLEWSDVPQGTKSFAITCFDPDAPTGSGFWHWLVVNVPADVRSLAEGAGEPQGSALPRGAMQTRTDFGAPGYAGPCPPDGPHRYVFTIFALSVEQLPVTPDTSAALVGFHLTFNTIAKASMIGMARPKK